MPNVPCVICLLAVPGPAVPPSLLPFRMVSVKLMTSPDQYARTAADNRAAMAGDITHTSRRQIIDEDRERAQRNHVGRSDTHQLVGRPGRRKPTHQHGDLAGDDGSANMRYRPVAHR